MQLHIPMFRGMNAVTSENKLAPDMAVEAINCQFRRGEFEPLRGCKPSEITTPLNTNTQSIFIYHNHLLSWPEAVNPVASPIAQDPYDRVYWTGEDVPRYGTNAALVGSGKMPLASYKLGVPAPVSAVTVSVEYHDQSGEVPEGDDPGDYSDPYSGTNVSLDDDETRFYLITFVSSSGEEGPGSPVSAAVEIRHPNDVVKVSMPGFSFSNRDINRVRLYRTVTGSSVTELFRVAEFVLSTPEFVDNVSFEALGPAYETEEYLPPPDNMQGLVEADGGVFVGFAGNELIPSDPYLPYAYPKRNRQSIADEIMGLASISAGLIMVTKGKPRLVSGITPDSYSVQTLDINQACVSSRSLVDMGEWAIYASRDGLVGINGSTAQLATSQIFTPEQWRERFKPESIHAYRWEGKYVGFYAGLGGFVFDPDTADFSLLDIYADGGCYHQGVLFLVIDDVLYEFDHDLAEVLSATWRSKSFVTPDIAFGVLRVLGENLAGTRVKVLANGENLVELTLSAGDDVVSRLPPKRARQWQIELAGTGRVKSLVLASSMAEAQL